MRGGVAGTPEGNMRHVVKVIDGNKCQPKTGQTLSFFHPPTLSLPLFSLVMIPLYLSLAALSCLSFAGAEPFHFPLTRRSNPLSMDDFVNAAHALRIKYGYTPSSPSKRQNTAGIPIINQVCPCSTP
jgi:hypothetical protein